MVDRAELVLRARDLVPVLRERAARTEELRQMPEETIRDLCAAELLRVEQPKRFGGLGLDHDAMLEVAAELGRGCGSASWCYSIWASHNWAVGMFSENAQEEYWAKSVDTLCCTSFNPTHTNVTRVEGGYRVTGRWDFSSGCDASTWGMLTGAGPDGPIVFLIPDSEFVVEDTWFVSGLQGTGSKDILVEDVFVPEHRALPWSDMLEARTPGRRIHDTPNYRIPLLSLFAFTLSGPILGMAQGALEAFETWSRERVSVQMEHIAEFPGTQMRVAEAAAEIYAARLIMENDCREIFERARRSEMPSLDDHARYRRDQCYMTRLSVQALNRIFEAAGGYALYSSSPTQRFHRDAHAASHHFALSWDVAAEQYGRLRLGLQPTSLSM